MSSSSLGPALVTAGLVLAAIGGVIWAGGSGWLSWFGRLPGDIRIERDTVRLYVPLASMLLVSAILSLIMYLFRKLS